MIPLKMPSRWREGSPEKQQQKAVRGRKTLRNVWVLRYAQGGGKLF